jgi:putative ABC transport system ATP-binding protein
MEMLDALHASGQTILLVTHEEYIAAHAHRTIRLRDGRVEADVSNGDGHRPARAPEAATVGAGASLA